MKAADALYDDTVGTATDHEMAEAHLEGALPSLREQFLAEVREKLGSNEVRAVAGRAAYEDFDPTGDWGLLEERLRMTWEGNTAAGIEAALDHTFPAQQEAGR